MASWYYSKMSSDVLPWASIAIFAESIHILWMQQVSGIAAQSWNIYFNFA